MCGRAQEKFDFESSPTPHVCPNGHPVSATDRFCPECASPAHLECPEGHRAKAGDQFCRTCGVSLAAAASE
jgi:hypothetical protein